MSEIPARYEIENTEEGFIPVSPSLNAVCVKIIVEYFIQMLDMGANPGLIVKEIKITREGDKKAIVLNLGQIVNIAQSYAAGSPLKTVKAIRYE